VRRIYVGLVWIGPWCEIFFSKSKPTKPKTHHQPREGHGARGESNAGLDARGNLHLRHGEGRAHGAVHPDGEAAVGGAWEAAGPGPDICRHEDVALELERDGAERLWVCV
jgi:hypothetical protein